MQRAAATPASGVQRARMRGMCLAPADIRSDRGSLLPSIRGVAMNSIIYLVGLIVVILAILSFLGLR
ncbi:MAG TPA: hypothetical protein PJ986_14615 [Gammaproteobacteria bacterium]|nr:hypothetical protein [Gammaproteobacteria bacterium]